MKGLFTIGVLLAVFAVAAAQNSTEETFEEVEKNFKRSVGNIVKQILPYIMENAGETEISGPCRAGIMKIIGGVRQLREWAMRFIDATGKLPAGILEGTSIAVGDYDECLDIKVGKRDDPPKTPSEIIFKGQYCLLEAHRPEGINKAIKEYQDGNKDAAIAKTKTFLNMFIRYKHLSNSTFKLGVCVPSKCSVEDIENILSSDSLKGFGRITVQYCNQDETEDLSAEIIILICIFGSILGVAIIGTIIDMGLRLRSRDQREKESPDNIKYLESVANNTSLYSNALALFNQNTTESIRSLCGIRTLVVVLTIYSHTYGHLHSLHFQKFSKAANFVKFFDSFTFSGIANGSVGMDTIFFLAGITITYSRWKSISEKSKVKLEVGKLLLQRYFRMTAAQLLVICFFLLFPLNGSGPFWSPYVDPELKNCRKRWWMNILYIHNFISSSKTCLYHTWVLAVIMQLTLVSVLIIWILKRSMRFGIFSMCVLTISGIIGVAVVTVINQLPGSMAFFVLDIRTAPITWTDIFILPYDHVGPFCIGLLTGYFLAKKKDQLHISRPVTVFFWCLSSACSTAVLFGLYSYRNGDPVDLGVGAFYAVMHRNVWALSIAWLVIACATKHGGAVARVLHSNFFVPTDRLSYLSFLVHIPIMYYHSGVIRERWYMGHFELLFLALGYICLSFFTSFVMYIIFVRPYLALEEHVASYFKTKRTVDLDAKPRPSLSKHMNSGIIIETPCSATGCVNVAYAKTNEDI